MDLKKLRINKQLLQKEVASKAGISKAFYSMIESGQRVCSIHNGSKIATILDISLDEFYNLLNKNK